MNDAITYTELRQRLKHYLDKVCASHTPLLVMRPRGDAVVVSREDYESLEETAYLLGGPQNRKRLQGSLARGTGSRAAFSSVKALRDEAGI